jgi:hypothetical protein
VTRQELAQRQQEFERDKWRYLFPRWLALLLPTVFLPLGVGVCLREGGAPEWAAVAAGLVGVAGAPLWAWCGDFMIARLRRIHGVECPPLLPVVSGLVSLRPVIPHVATTPVDVVQAEAACLA